jgi:hypothetical protein
MQRAGRGGRMVSIQARAVLFLEASALKEIHTRMAGVCALDGWMNGVRLGVIVTTLKIEPIEVSGCVDVVRETGGDMVARERAVQIVVVV